MSEVKNENRDWYFFDAKDYVLGRLSTEVADLLRGKKKVSFRENSDSGDYVVITNVEKILLTGDKENQKVYRRHTGYIGNLKTTTVPELRKSKPEEIIKHSVLGMLPKNRLRDGFMKRLKVYAGNKHPHGNVVFKNQG